MQYLRHITLLVDDYDRAIAFFTQKLHFELVEDTLLEENKRWVVVKPAGPGFCTLLLAKAAHPEQETRIGNQTGGRVFLFLYTTKFDEDHARLLRNNIPVVRPPRQEPYGKVLVFQDIFGNLWDLIEPVSPL